MSEPLEATSFHFFFLKNIRIGKVKAKEGKALSAAMQRTGKSGFSYMLSQRFQMPSKHFSIIPKTL